MLRSLLPQKGMGNIKISIRVLGWFFIVFSAWNIFNWLALLFCSDRLSLYLADINRAGISFTHASFMLFGFGILIIQAIQLIASVLFSKQKEAGRRLFMYSAVVFFLHDLIWLIANLVMERSISYFILPVIMNGVVSLLLVKMLNRPRIKEYFN